MSASVNGKSILGGIVDMPAAGAWVARLRVDASEELPAGARAITVDVGGQTLIGTIARQGEYAGSLEVRIVAGSGGIGSGTLGKTVAAKAYKQVPARIVAADILTAAGETLSATVSAAVLAQSLPFWHRHGGTAASAWGRLMRALGVSWRVLADGSVWFGVETWPTASLAADELERVEGRGFVVYSPDAPILPATTVAGRRLGAVVYTFTDASVRVEAEAA